MMKKAFLLVALMVGSVLPSSAQVINRWDYIATTTATDIGTAIPLLVLPNVGVSFYSNCITLPCTTPAATYYRSALGLTVACPSTAQVNLQITYTCVSNADVQGNFGAWFVAGTYQYVITSGNVSYGPYNFTVGGGNGGGGSGTGPTNPVISFTNATSVTMPYSTYGFNANGIIVACYDLNGNLIEGNAPNISMISATAYTLNLSFAFAESGYCTANSYSSGNGNSGNLTVISLTASGAITAASGTFSGNVQASSLTGNLTGNVTGNVSGGVNTNGTASNITGFANQLFFRGGNTLIDNNGFGIGWNNSFKIGNSLTGETDFFNQAGTDSGGFAWYNNSGCANGVCPTFNDPTKLIMSLTTSSVPSKGNLGSLHTVTADNFATTTGTVPVVVATASISCTTGSIGQCSGTASWSSAITGSYKVFCGPVTLSTGTGYFIFGVNPGSSTSFPWYIGSSVGVSDAGKAVTVYCEAHQ